MKTAITFILLVTCFSIGFSQKSHPYLTQSNHTEEVVNQFLRLSEEKEYEQLMNILTDSTTLIDYNSREIPGLKGSWTGREIMEMMKGVSEKITDKTETIISSFVSGSYYIQNFETKYKQQQGDKIVQHYAKGTKIFHVFNGRILAIHEYLDYDALLRQNLGLDKR